MSKLKTKIMCDEIARKRKLNEISTGGRGRRTQGLGKNYWPGNEVTRKIYWRII